MYWLCLLVSSLQISWVCATVLITLFLLFTLELIFPFFSGFLMGNLRRPVVNLYSLLIYGFYFILWNHPCHTKILSETITTDQYLPWTVKQNPQENIGKQLQYYTQSIICYHQVGFILGMKWKLNIQVSGVVSHYIKKDNGKTTENIKRCTKSIFQKSNTLKKISVNKE